MMQQLCRSLCLQRIVRCLTLYADDVRWGDKCHDMESPEKLVENFGKLLDVISAMGLEANPQKSHALISVDGHAYMRAWRKHIAIRNRRRRLTTPRTDGAVTLAPIAEAAGYLGFDCRAVSVRTRLNLLSPQAFGSLCQLCPIASLAHSATRASCSAMSADLETMRLSYHHLWFT